MAQYSITAQIGAETKGLTKGLKKAQSEIRGMKSKMGNMGMGGVAAAAQEAGRAILEFGVDAVKTAGKIDASMNEVFTLLPGLSKGAKDKMTQDMLALSQEMGKMPEDMIGSLYNALSAGVPKENVFNFLKEASKASIAGVSTTNEAVGALTTVLNGYRLSADKAGDISDVLFTTIKNGVTTMPELAKNIGKITPLAASLGVEFEHVGAMFAEMTKNLGPGKSAEAGTMLKTMLAELSKESQVAAKNFKKLTGKSFRDFIAGGGDVKEALLIMSKAAEKNGQSVSDMFGSIEAGNAALILTAKNAAGLGEQMGNMKGRAGATNEAFKTVDQGFSRMMEKLMAGFEVFKHTVGTALGPVVNVLMPLFLKGLKMIQKLPWDKLGKTLEGNLKLIEPLYDVLFDFVKEVFPLIGPLMRIGITTMNMMMPVLMALMKILVALMPVIVWLVDKIAVIFDLLNRMIHWVVKLIQGIGKGKEAAEKTAKAGTDAVKDVKSEADKFLSWIKKAWAWIMGAVKTFWNSIKGVWGDITYFFGELQTILLAPFKLLWGLLADGHRKLVRTLLGIRDRILNVRQELIDKLYEMFPWLEDLVNWIKGKILDHVAAVKAFVLKRIQAMKDFIFGIVSKTWNYIKDVVMGLWAMLKEKIAEIRNKVMTSNNEIVEALRFFWLLAEEVFGSLISILKKAVAVFGKVGDAVGWVAGKLGLANDENKKLNDEISKTAKTLGDSKGAAEEQKDAIKEGKEEQKGMVKGAKELFEKLKGGVKAEQEKQVAAQKTAKQMAEQAAKAEQVRIINERGLAQARQRELHNKQFIQQGAKIIKQSGVHTAQLMAAAKKHKDINSIAELYTIIAQGKKTPQQIIAEAFGQQNVLNAAGKKYNLTSKDKKTPAQQVKEATNETKKLNAEAAKNPLLALKGANITAKATIDKAQLDQLRHVLMSIAHTNASIDKSLKGKFVNQ